jgi:hypothetical protein
MASSRSIWIIVACAAFATDLLATIIVLCSGLSHDDFVLGALFVGRLIGPPLLAIVAVRLARPKIAQRAPRELAPVAGHAPLLGDEGSCCGGAGALTTDVEAGASTVSTASSSGDTGDARARKIDSVIHEKK